MNYERQIRDEKVVIHLGYHTQLSQKQIQQLEFPSYQTCQRRIRECLIPEKLISKPTYLYINDKKTPIYKLLKKGRELYETRTGNKAKKKYFSFRYTPHLIETNSILVWLKKRNIINSEQFTIEKNVNNKRIDCLIELENKYIAIEVDLSESDWKKEIQKQYLSYTDIKLDKPFDLIYYTNRKIKLKKWIKEVADYNVNPFFTTKRSPYKIEMIIKKDSY